MTDIKSSDVWKFIEWVTAMPKDAKSLATFIISGSVMPRHARWVEKNKPDVFEAYGFIKILAGHGDGKLESLLDEARRELVADFYIGLM